MVVHVRVIITSMTIALVVMYHTSRIAGKEKLVVLGELDAGYPRFVVVNDMHGCCLVFRCELKDAYFVVEIAAHIQIHILWAALVIEFCE